MEWGWIQRGPSVGAEEDDYKWTPPGGCDYKWASPRVTLINSVSTKQWMTQANSSCPPEDPSLLGSLFLPKHTHPHIAWFIRGQRSMWGIIQRNGMNGPYYVLIRSDLIWPIFQFAKLGSPVLLRRHSDCPINIQCNSSSGVGMGWGFISLGYIHRFQWGHFTSSSPPSTILG